MHLKAQSDPNLFPISFRTEELICFHSGCLTDEMFSGQKITDLHEVLQQSFAGQIIQSKWNKLA